MKEKVLYSIGYGNRTILDFIKIIEAYNIKSLIDVRSIPFSKYNPDFEKKQLEYHLKIKNVKYYFMGDQLGGRPSDEDQYNNDKVDYESLGTKETFKKGINTLILLKMELTSVIMCSEIKPENCHRSKLLGRELKKNGINIMHIDEKNEIKTQERVMDIVTKGQGEFDIFGEIPLSSRKKYKKD